MDLSQEFQNFLFHTGGTSFRKHSPDISSFYNSVRTEISHVHNLGNSQEVLSYFDKHSSEYSTLTKKDIEDIFNRRSY